MVVTEEKGREVWEGAGNRLTFFIVTFFAAGLAGTSTSDTGDSGGGADELDTPPFRVESCALLAYNLFVTGFVTYATALPASLCSFCAFKF